jgi:putative hydrolase of the HAD superfamily
MSYVGRRHGSSFTQGAILQQASHLEGIRAVYFDAVGTVLFPAAPVAATYRTVAARHGADLDEATIRSRLVDAFMAEERADEAAVWRTDEARERERWRQIVTVTLAEVPDPDACFTDLWDHFRSPAAWVVHPDLSDVLSELARRGIPAGIASNFDARLLHIVAATPALAVLADRCLVSSLVGWRKPAAGFFAELVQREGCRPEEILLVGDDLLNDYLGARAAGLRAVLIGAAGKSEAEQRIEKLAELL